MIKLIKKSLQKYSRIIDKKPIKVLIESLLIIWVLGVFFLYCYNHIYFYVIFKISWPIFFITMVAYVFFGNITLDKALFHRLVKRMIKKDQINIRLEYLFLIVPLLTIILANILWIYFVTCVHLGNADFNFYIYDALTNKFNDIGYIYHSRIPIYLIILLIGSFFLLWKKFKLSKQACFLFHALKCIYKHRRRAVLINIICLCVLPLVSACIYILLSPQSQLAKFLATNDLLFYELSIIEKVFTTYIFYGLLVLLVYALGRKIFKLLKLNFESELEEFIFSIGIGFIPLMLVTFFIALLGWLYAWTMWLMIVACLILSRKEVAEIFSKLKKKYYDLSFQTPWLSFKNLVLIGLSILLIINFISAFKPAPDDYDSLHTYFNAPKLYVTYHEYRPLMHFNGSNMGQNIEMLYTFVLSVLSSRFIVHFSLLFFVLYLIGSYSLLKRLFNEKYAYLGVIVLYFIPWNFSFIYQNKVEFALAFYSLLMLYLFFLWYENGHQNKYLYLLGVVSGIALGIKYNAALLIIPLFLIVFTLKIIYHKESIFKSIKALIVSGLLIILFFAPWAIKNQIYFNNIFYPISITDGHSSSTSGLQQYGISYDFLTKRNQEILYLKESIEDSGNFFWDMMGTIWHKSLGTYYGSTHTDFGIIFLIVLPLGALLLIRNKKTCICLLIATAYFVIWFFISTGRSWYAFFGFTVLYITLPYLLLRNKKLLYLYSFFMLIVAVTYALRIPPFNVYYLAGLVDQERYLSDKVTHYDIAKHVNKLKLGVGEKIYIGGDPRVAFINSNDERVLTEFYYEAVGSWLYQGGEDYLIKKFNEANVKYVLYTRARRISAEFWLESKGLTINSYLENYNKSIPSIFEDEERFYKFLTNQGEHVAIDEDYELFRLKGNEYTN